ncbi:MAG: FKBP-type peptidyl-prolyl cis-trans isomerase [Bacteroidota bacterium]
MQAVKTILATATIALAISACNNVDFKKTSNGVPYKIFGNNKGDSIAINQIVKFHYIQKTKDTVLGSTYTSGTPQYMQIQPANASAPYTDLGATLSEVFRKAHKGDSIEMVVSVDSVLKQFPEMGKTGPFKKGSDITVTARILEVYKTQEEARVASDKDRIAGAEVADAQNLERAKKDTAFSNRMAIDNKIIDEHLAAKNIQATKTPWGVYVQMITPGSGPKPAAGQFANLKYKGTSLAGAEFDAGMYPLQIGMGGSIKGFEEGAKQLGKGGKAIIYVPSLLAYGPQGSPPKIAPFQVLVFELEMLDITNTAPAQPAMPLPDGHSKDDGHGH